MRTRGRGAKVGLVSVALTLGLASSACAFRAAEPSIWDGTIMPQPFETQPFRAVKLPSWVEDTLGCGYTLSVMDTAGRARAAGHGVTISEMGFVDPFYAYYDSKLLKKRSPHVPPDRLAKDIAEYKRLGVHILGVYPPCLQGEVYETHPEWRRVATRTDEIPQIDMKQFPHGGILCLLGPYGDFFIDVLAEIVTTFPDVDAFSFDGLHYGGVCYCKPCRAAFRKETGNDIPATDLNDPAFRRYQHWADRRMENLIRRMQTRLKSIKSTLALVTWTTNSGRFGHFLSIPRNMPARMNLLLDAPDQEFWLDETNRGSTIVPAFANAYAWAVTNHRVAFSEPYLMSHGNPYGKDSFPGHEILRRMLLSVTHGTLPSIAVGQPANLQEAVYQGLDEVRKRKPWITHKRPEPWAALVVSDNTRNFYGRSAGLVEERYMANVFGAFRAGLEEHLPITLINDWNLNDADLARYKVLILANTACLDDAQNAAIEKFVRNGGGLVATLDTSMFNEYGDPRSGFALKEVLGLDHLGLPLASGKNAADLDVNFAQAIGVDYWEKRKNVFEFRPDPRTFLLNGKLRDYLGDQPVTFKGPAVRVRPRGADVTVLATMHDRLATGAPEIPAVLSRTHGQGRVVYFAAGLDSAYYLYSYPYQRLALKEAINWAASAPAPVHIEAPMCVHSNLTRQTVEGRERLVLHLYNDLNTTAAHAFPNDDVPLREEVVPVAGIGVTFGPQYHTPRVRLEPEGIELPVTRSDRGTRVTIPRLEVHTMVVAELEDRGR